MLEKLTDHLYVYPYSEETDRPNLYYIRGENEAIAVDAGNSTNHLKAFYQALKEAKLPLPKRTVLSHWHWDHTFGLAGVIGESYSSEATYEKLKEVAGWSWTLKAMEERLASGEDIPFCHENILREYPDLSQIRVALPTHRLKTAITEWDLGNYPVQIIAEPSTHTLDSVFVYLPCDQMLIVQDSDCEDFYHGAVYEVSRLKRLIAFLEALDYKWHLLGHGEPERKSQALNRLYQALDQLAQKG